MDGMKFSPGWLNTMLKVGPGLTGMRQIQGMGASSFHDWVCCDVICARNHPLWLDFKTFLMTIPWVLKRRALIDEFCVL
ncbi:MAG: sugar transferase [Thermodesulfobacteriota bacterium]